MITRYNGANKIADVAAEVDEQAITDNVISKARIPVYKHEYTMFYGLIAHCYRIGPMVWLTINGNPNKTLPQTGTSNEKIGASYRPATGSNGQGPFGSSVGLNAQPNPGSITVNTDGTITWNRPFGSNTNDYTYGMAFYHTTSAAPSSSDIFDHIELEVA